MTFTQIRDFGWPIIHFNIYIGRIFTIPRRILPGIRIPDSLQISRLCSRLWTGNKQITPKLKIQGGQWRIIYCRKLFNPYIGRFLFLFTVIAQIQSNTSELLLIFRNMIRFGLLVIFVKFVKILFGTCFTIGTDIFITNKIGSCRDINTSTISIRNIQATVCRRLTTSISNDLYQWMGMQQIRNIFFRLFPTFSVNRQHIIGSFHQLNSHLGTICFQWADKKGFKSHLTRLVSRNFNNNQLICQWSKNLTGIVHPIYRIGYFGNRIGEIQFTIIIRRCLVVFGKIEQQITDWLINHPVTGDIPVCNNISQC